MSAIAGLRRLAAPAPAAAPEERCELCTRRIGEEHRHLLQLDDRHILCVCEACWAMRGGDDALRPVGTRHLWLEDFDLPDELWAAFGLPIGLAFFVHSSSTGGVAALYPSPVGATESELDLAAWDELVARNPVLAELEADAEALVVNRLAAGGGPAYAIAPIDECYGLVGAIRASWEGISGGPAVEQALPAFFARLREAAR